MFGCGKGNVKPSESGFGVPRNPAPPHSRRGSPPGYEPCHLHGRPGRGRRSRALSRIVKPHLPLRLPSSPDCCGTALRAVPRSRDNRSLLRLSGCGSLDLCGGLVLQGFVHKPDRFLKRGHPAQREGSSLPVNGFRPGPCCFQRRCELLAHLVETYRSATWPR